MILFLILFAMLILAFLAFIVYRSYLKDEAARDAEIEREIDRKVKEAIEYSRKGRDENGK